MKTRPSKQEYNLIRAKEGKNKEIYYSGDGEAAEPHTICFSVNNNCNMLCKMCDVGQFNAQKKKSVEDNYFSKRYMKESRKLEFPLKRIYEIIDEVATFKPIIKTNFMEPLLYRDLREVLRYTKQKGLKYYLVTNGWLLKSNADWLVELNADLIRVSLDGTADVHNSIRGVKRSFDKVIDGIHAVVAKKRQLKVDYPILGICCTISPYNYTCIVPFMEELERTGILSHVYVNFNHLLYTTVDEVLETQKESDDFLHLSPCSVMENELNNMEVTRLNSQIKLLQQRFDSDKYHYYFSPHLEAKDMQTYYSPHTEMFPGTLCFLPWYSAQIEVNGDVGIYGHCVLPPFGNIMDKNFMEVWNSERAIKIRRNLKNIGSYSACNKCIGTLYPLRGRS